MGAARAGFKVHAAIEIDDHAFHTHKDNFPNAIHIKKSVDSLSGPQILALTGLEQGQLEGLIGGPPCQGFSRIGKRQSGDTRNSLFYHFFRLVNELQPSFYVAENVPGILDDNFNGIVNNALALVKGYEQLDPILLKASDYGAPTTRTRVFFIGYKKNLFRPIRESDFIRRKTTKPITVKIALSGLPRRINPHWQSETLGWRKGSEKPHASYRRLALGHIPLGVGSIIAINRLLNKGEISGCLGTVHQPDVISRFSLITQGDFDPISRAIRLRQNGFCPTLRAGTGPDRGSYQAVRPIHPTQDRVITPREAARLQGFPDWFVFHPTKWHSFRQIGNSVSPILAEKVMKIILARKKE